MIDQLPEITFTHKRWLDTLQNSWVTIMSPQTCRAIDVLNFSTLSAEDTFDANLTMCLPL